MSNNLKITHYWSILCERSIIDSETNNITLNNIIEEIQVHPKKDGVPIGVDVAKPFPMKCELVSLWENQDSAKSVKISIKIGLFDSNGKQILPKEIPVDLVFEKNRARLRHRVRFEALFFTVPGIYSFRIFGDDGQLLGDSHFELKLQLK